MAVAPAERLGRLRNLGDWRGDGPPQGADRVVWLRAEASALLSEARDLELQREFPPSHECICCEQCRLTIISEAHRMHYV